MTIEQKAINAIRTLSIDAIEKANSGHPGLPMGAAPMTYTLWTKHMTHNPKNSKWFNRDRFVLSAGHGSMLLYSMLHLSGYDVTVEDLKQFRQWNSRTPGHPEYGYTDGVEATTGPLGQGFAMSVGMAMAEAHLAAKYNKADFNIVDHYTYALISDGDVMEGISHEAASLAGHLGLHKLIALYDSNDISLDGELNLSFSENTEQRFKAYGWEVLRVEDGNNIDEINTAIKKAKQNKEQPSLIEIKTIIGYGSPNKSNSSKAHGAPLGKDEVQLTKDYYSWNHKEFEVPQEVYEHFEEVIVKKGSSAESKWLNLFSEYEKQYPELASELKQIMLNKLPSDWDQNLPLFTTEDHLATRAASGKVLNALSKQIPQLFGGSADLASSNNTMMDNEGNFSKENYAGRNIWFGVREFGMAAAANGIALHSGLKPYVGTFFVFSDYLRAAVRLSALMEVPVTYVLTHDSIAVGEDGPTHEPVEQLAAFRAMPNVSVIRPADGNETLAAWKLSMEAEDHPTLLVLTRQNLPTLPNTKELAYEGVKKGAYIISDSDKSSPDALLIATGSEVQLAVKAQEELKQRNIDVRVISMPSWDRFEKQDETYKEKILPKNVTARLAIEMASSLGWHKYVGNDGKVLSVDKFGASAPGDKILKEYGFTVENVVEQVLSLKK